MVVGLLILSQVALAGACFGVICMLVVDLVAPVGRASDMVRTDAGAQALAGCPRQKRERLLCWLGGSGLGAAAAVAFWLRQAAPQALIGLAMSSLLMFCSIYDTRTLRIPNLVSGLVLALGVAAAWLDDRLMEGAVLCLAVALGLAALDMALRRARARPALGGGDIKLLAAVSVWLGVDLFPACLVLAAASALVWAKARGLAPGEKLPFGPFIAGSAVLVALFARKAWPCW